MLLNNDNYFSPEAMMEYWSVSQFKTFSRCEAAGLAEARGEYQREETDALLIGSYVDAHFSGEMERFMAEHAGQMYSKRTGDLLAKFQHANDLIERVEADPMMMEYLEGEHQKILTADVFGVPWKIKMDVWTEDRIVDFKTVKDFADVYDPGYGRRSWVEYWGYDIQGAIYQKVEGLNSGKRKPFYLAAVTKEKVPDIKIVHIPQHILDTALGLVEAKIDRFDLVKSGDLPPIRCETCNYCKQTKILETVEEYEIKEAE